MQMSVVDVFVVNRFVVGRSYSAIIFLRDERMGHFQLVNWV